MLLLKCQKVAVKVHLGSRACAGRLWWRCGYHATGGTCLTDFGTTGGLWLLRGQGWEAWCHSDTSWSWTWTYNIYTYIIYIQHINWLWNCMKLQSFLCRKNARWLISNYWSSRFETKNIHEYPYFRIIGCNQVLVSFIASFLCWSLQR